MTTHGLALSNRTTSCGQPLTPEQLAVAGLGLRTLRLVPLTCPACIAAEQPSGSTPWFAKRTEPQTAR
jgi:hypothetical protein